VERRRKGSSLHSPANLFQHRREREIPFPIPTRNLTLRLLEPLGALEEEDDAEPETSKGSIPSPDGGIAIAFEGVSVLAGGHTILHEFDLEIDPGSHVAIVGRSGAGKSSLIGLLLGWHRTSLGKILVDGEHPEN